MSLAVHRAPLPRLPGGREGVCGSNACSGVVDWPPLPSLRSAPPPQAGEEALLRLRLIHAVPIRRRRLSAIRRDALDIHVVEAGDVDAVGGLAAALDQFERVVPLLLAVSGQHLRVELAQFPAMRILIQLAAAEHG